MTRQTTTCIVCGHSGVCRFLRIERMPVLCTVLHRTRSQALDAPTAPISLGFCHDCGHIFNTEFAPHLTEYDANYENSLYFSGRFREYADSLVETLVRRYRLSRCTIVEIGCGRGDFLKALCRRGNNRGVGFDPGSPPDEEIVDTNCEISIHHESFNGSRPRFEADFICSRHTLEHIAQPRKFLSSIRNASVRTGVPVFFEVPNGLHTLDGGAWDLIYEHCSYFSPSSLARVFVESGYRGVQVDEAFEGQFLTLNAHVSGNSDTEGKPSAPARLAQLVDVFAKKYRRTVADWGKRFETLRRDGRKVVVWGAGSKGIAFLNTLRPSAVDYIVDLNPRKQGSYTTGTGQLIVPPAFLAEYKPEVVIVMNPVYANEIRQSTDALGIKPSFLFA